jgi:hypothetical protein
MQIRVGRTRPTARRPRCALTRFREPAGACTPPGHLPIVLHHVDHPKAVNPQAVRAFYGYLDRPRDGQTPWSREEPGACDLPFWPIWPGHGGQWFECFHYAREQALRRRANLCKAAELAIPEDDGQVH